MSTGFLNNNAGNINQTKDNWEGMTGETITTQDGQKNLVFIDVVFGLRALMTIIDNKIENNRLNIYQFVKSYVGLKDENKINDYIRVINNYSTTDFDPRPQALPIDATYVNVLAIAQGVVQNEIPEYSKISSQIWQEAINYYSGDNHDYNPNYDFRKNTTIDTVTKGSILFISLIVIVVIFRKKIFF